MVDWRDYMKIKRWHQMVAGMAISAGGLWVFLHDVDPAQLGARLTSTEPLVLGACALLAVTAILLRALRWRIMLPASPGTSTRGLGAIVFIGFMVNNILPARLGEATRAFILWKRNGFSPTVAIGSLLVERLLDVLFFLGFFFVPVLAFGLIPSLVPYAVLTAAGTAVVMGFFVLYAAIPDRAARGVQWLATLLPERWRGRAHSIAHELLATLGWLQSWHRTAAVFVLSFVTLSCYAGMLLLLTRGEGALSFTQSLSASAFAALGAAIPLSPGYVGTLHAALFEGLSLLGQGRESARAVAILYHALGYIPTTLVGLFYFFRLDLRFKDISQARETIE